MDIQLQKKYPMRKKSAWRNIAFARTQLFQLKFVVACKHQIEDFRLDITIRMFK